MIQSYRVVNSSTFGSTFSSMSSVFSRLSHWDSPWMKDPIWEILGTSWISSSWWQQPSTKCSLMPIYPHWKCSECSGWFVHWESSHIIRSSKWSLQPYSSLSAPLLTYQSLWWSFGWCSQSMAWTPSWACSSTAPKNHISTIRSGCARIMVGNGFASNRTLTTSARRWWRYSSLRLWKVGPTSCISHLMLQRGIMDRRCWLVQPSHSSSLSSFWSALSSSSTSSSVCFSSNTNRRGKRKKRDKRMSSYSGKRCCLW